MQVEQVSTVEESATEKMLMPDTKIFRIGNEPATDKMVRETSGSFH